jgi:hypothetical protein
MQPRLGTHTLFHKLHYAPVLLMCNGTHTLHVLHGYPPLRLELQDVSLVRVGMRQSNYHTGRSATKVEDLSLYIEFNVSHQLAPEDVQVLPHVAEGKVNHRKVSKSENRCR